MTSNSFLSPKGEGNRKKLLLLPNFKAHWSSFHGIGPIIELRGTGELLFHSEYTSAGVKDFSQPLLVCYCVHGQ